MPQPPKRLDDAASLAAWFGKELRNWRRVRGLSADALGEKVHLSGSSIVKIEKATRSCSMALAAALDEALDAGGALHRLWRRVEQEEEKRTDADTARSAPSGPDASTPGPGMLRMDPLPSERSPVERRRFAALTATGIAALATEGLVPITDTVAAPAAVRPDDVEQVRVAAATLAGWDNLFGGAGVVRATSLGQFHWARGLLEARCPAELRPDLFSAVGRLATVLGAAAFDAYEHDQARLLLRFATDCAEEGDDWHLRATSLNWRARQEIWVGNPDTGLTHAESGLVRADRLTPREQAMLHNARARALGKMGRVQETLRSVGRSDEIFARAKQGEDVPWMAYYESAQHHGDTGHSLYDLALLTGHSPRPAARRFEIAINGHADAYARSRAISRTKLASLTMATGNPDEAVDLAHRALDEVGRLRSRRAAEDVHDLDCLASRRRGGQIAELRERIRINVLA
ncbi:helix-turn-helix domain-containing protein [Streptomyces sp. NPDC048172]|uniref:helix-turn-helix domain-containing protein n=1 Tax=Streptomyces sp. NPDC048172 TaxID=3365505 RepID=UPI00371C1749